MFCNDKRLVMMVLLAGSSPDEKVQRLPSREREGGYMNRDRDSDGHRRSEDTDDLGNYP